MRVFNKHENSFLLTLRSKEPLPLTKKITLKVNNTLIDNVKFGILCMSVCPIFRLIFDEIKMIKSYNKLHLISPH